MVGELSRVRDQNCGTNNLPIELRMEKDTDAFKKLLKSFLMTSADVLYNRVNMR